MSTLDAANATSLASPVIGPYAVDEFIEAATRFHGYAAPGLVLGVENGIAWPGKARKSEEPGLGGMIWDILGCGAVMLGSEGEKRGLLDFRLYEMSWPAPQRCNAGLRAA
jgi:hypothetical protein